MTTDPTADEMREFLGASVFADECDEFDREEAIYWFANDYHGGQWSNLYSALSTSEFSPGPIASAPHGSAQYLYDELVAEYAADVDA